MPYDLCRYVSTISSILNNFVPQIAGIINSTYFCFFCEKFIACVARHNTWCQEEFSVLSPRNFVCAWTCIFLNVLCSVRMPQVQGTLSYSNPERGLSTQMLAFPFHIWKMLCQRNNRDIPSVSNSRSRHCREHSQLACAWAWCWPVRCTDEITFLSVVQFVKELCSWCGFPDRLFRRCTKAFSSAAASQKLERSRCACANACNTQPFEAS